ncbi:uncharacterized protein LOC144459934 [Epinephelus lanceolatus]
MEPTHVTFHPRQQKTEESSLAQANLLPSHHKIDSIRCKITSVATQKYTVSVHGSNQEVTTVVGNDGTAAMKIQAYWRQKADSPHLRVHVLHNSPPDQDQRPVTQPDHNRLEF